MSSTSWRLRAPAGNRTRILGVAVLVLVAFELFYVGVANAVLASGVLERTINAKPDKLHVTFERPWTLWPGRVHVDRFALRIQDSGVQFQLGLSDASLNLEIWKLLKQQFSISELTASNVSFRLRTKVKGEEPLELVRARRFAPIAGFSDPPLKGPWPKSNKEPWTIQIENVSAGLRELWIQEFRYAGNAHVTGGFLLKPAERIWVERAAVRFDRAPLRWGKDEPLFASIQGNVEAYIRDHDLRGRSADQLLEQLTAHASLGAEVTSLGFMQGFVAPESVALGGGAGRVDVNLKVARGVLLPGSDARYGTGHLTVRTGSVMLKGDTHARASVALLDGKARGTLAIGADRLAVGTAQQRRGIENASFTKPNMELSTQTLDLTKRWMMSGGHFEVPALKVPDLRLLNGFGEGQQPWQVTGGSSAASGDARVLPSGEVVGRVTVDFTDAALRIKDVAMRTTGSFSTRLRQASADGDRGAFETATLLVREFEVSSRHGSTGKGSARALAPHIPYEKLRPTRLDVSVEARFHDAEPVLGALGVTKGTLPSIAAKVLDLSDLRVSGELHQGAAGTALVLRRASTDAVTASGRWGRGKNDRERAAFLLTSDVINAGIVLENGQSDVHLFVDEEWLSSELQRLDLAAEGPRRSTAAAPIPARRR
jgi:hypothetical protein